jgi:hypothetical protein
MNFGDLQAALLAQIGRAPSQLCYDMVTEDLNRSLRVRDNLKTITLSAEEEVPLPSDLAEISDVSVDNRLLRAAPITQRHAAYAVSGTPQTYSVIRNFLVLNPVPDSGEVTLRYWPKFTALSDSSDTNSILTHHSEVYVYGVLFHHSALTKDEEAAMAYGAVYERAKQAVKRYQVNSAVAGAAPAPMARTAP